MIRIPQSGRGSANHSPAADLSSQGGEVVHEPKTDRLEIRMDLLESKLASHADDLKETVTERVDQIESRFCRAMRSLSGKDGEGEVMENVIEFAAEHVGMHHLPTTAALEALHDLNLTLQLTKEHLDALGGSVSRMRDAVSKAS
tara:strand:- start:7762 stop:8193 length:432 start_codon:yes stop_codon:yes gene_type:complete